MKDDGDFCLFNAKKIINIISIAVLAAVSELYVLKFGLKHFENPVITSIGFLLIFIFGLLFIDRYLQKKIKQVIRNSLYILVVLIGVFFALAVLELPHDLTSERGEDITRWMENFQQGVYPYNDMLKPRAFPMLFLIVAPFHFLGDIAYLMVGAIVLFSLLLIKYSNTRRELLMRAALFFGNPLLYKGLMTRNDLFPVMVIFILIFFLAYEYLEPDQLNQRFFFFALFVGVMFATFLAVWILPVLFVLYFFRANLSRGLIFSSAAFLIFILILLPFMLKDWSYFIDRGPLTPGVVHFPLWSIFVLIIITIYAGWIVRDLQEVFFAAGMIYFTLITYSLIMTIITIGFEAAVLGNEYDLSYYIYCLPFFIFSVKDSKSDANFGKQLVFRDETEGSYTIP